MRPWQIGDVFRVGDDPKEYEIRDLCNRSDGRHWHIAPAMCSCACVTEDPSWHLVRPAGGIKVGDVVEFTTPDGNKYIMAVTGFSQFRDNEPDAAPATVQELEAKLATVEADLEAECNHSKALTARIVKLERGQPDIYRIGWMTVNDAGQMVCDHEWRAGIFGKPFVKVLDPSEAILKAAGKSGDA